MLIVLHLQLVKLGHYLWLQLSASIFVRELTTRKLHGVCRNRSNQVGEKVSGRNGCALFAKLVEKLRQLLERAEPRAARPWHHVIRRNLQINTTESVNCVKVSSKILILVRLT